MDSVEERAARLGRVVQLVVGQVQVSEAGRVVDDGRPVDVTQRRIVVQLDRHEVLEGRQRLDAVQVGILADGQALEGRPRDGQQSRLAHVPEPASNDGQSLYLTGAAEQVVAPEGEDAVARQIASGQLARLRTTVAVVVVDQLFTTNGQHQDPADEEHGPASHFFLSIPTASYILLGT